MKYRVAGAPAGVLAGIFVIAGGLFFIPQSVSGAPGLKDDLIKALEKALKDDDAYVRVEAASGLLRLSPSHKEASQELIKGLTSNVDYYEAVAHSAIKEVIPSAPPILVEELMKLLSYEHEKYRRYAAKFLAMIDPKALP